MSSALMLSKCCCGTSCKITLNLEDQRCSSTTRDVTLIVTGKIKYFVDYGPVCGSNEFVIKLYADEDGPITVNYSWWSPSAGCVQRFRPKVDGTFRNWDDGSELLEREQSKTVTMSKGQRLQLYMTNLNGCVDGDHDDNAGRATWSIENDCKTTCNPCFDEDTPQNNIIVELNKSCHNFDICGVADYIPHIFPYCTRWDYYAYGGRCARQAFIGVDRVYGDGTYAAPWLGYVIEINFTRTPFYDAFFKAEFPVGYSAAMYYGPSIAEWNAECDAPLGIAPLFVSMGGNVNTLNCGPNGKLTGKIELIGVSNAGDDYGRNMTGFTATLTFT